jgi:hypothetical protein
MCGRGWTIEEVTFPIPTFAFRGEKGRAAALSFSLPSLYITPLQESYFCGIVGICTATPNQSLRKEVR